MANIVEYSTPQGDKITLSPETVKKYLVSGNGSVTDQEVMMFLSLCKYQHLNPFLREAYLVKFGNEPATIITGKEVFTKRAASLKECKGFEAGVIVQFKEGAIDYRKGTLVLPNEVLVGGWAKVYKEDWTIPLEITISLKEYLRRKKDGTPAANWASMPATMIRKVALVQALREAFPNDFGGMYSPEEMPVDTQALPDAPIIDVKPEPEAKPKSTPKKATNGASASPPAQAPSDKKRNLLWVKAKEAGWNQAALKELVKNRTGKDSSVDLTDAEIDDLISYFGPIKKLIDIIKLLEWGSENTTLYLQQQFQKDNFAQTTNEEIQKMLAELAPIVEANQVAELGEEIIGEEVPF